MRGLGKVYKRQITQLPVRPDGGCGARCRVKPVKPPSKSRAAKPRREVSEGLHFDDVERLRAMVGAGDRFLLPFEALSYTHLTLPTTYPL